MSCDALPHVVCCNVSCGIRQFIYKYIRNGSEDLCDSVIGNCCGFRPGFRVLCPVTVRIAFISFCILLFSTYFEKYQGLRCRKGKSKQIVDLLVT